jgi:hypothetical protein
MHAERICLARRRSPWLRYSARPRLRGCARTGSSPGRYPTGNVRSRSASRRAVHRPRRRTGPSCQDESRRVRARALQSKPSHGGLRVCSFRRSSNVSGSSWLLPRLARHCASAGAWAVSRLRREDSSAPANPPAQHAYTVTARTPHVPAPGPHSSASRDCAGFRARETPYRPGRCGRCDLPVPAR